MQITLSLAPVTIPTPEPYDAAHPDKQRENCAYVALQVLAQAKQQGVKLTYTDIDGAPIGWRLDGVERATRDLAWNGQVIDLGPIQIVLTNRTLSIRGPL